MIRKLLSRRTDGPFSAGVLLAFGCVIAFAPDPFVLMMVRAFMWQWALLLLVVALFALGTRRWWSAGGALVAAVLLLFPLIAPRRSIQRSADGSCCAWRR